MTIEPAEDELVRVRDYIPDIAVELDYATPDNFTGQVIYHFTEPWLRYGTVKKLMEVQKGLRQQGFCLLIWDGYRPYWAQERLWEIVHDPAYVSDPATGSNSHCRGNTVDASLVTADGGAVEMPSGFDEFSALADRDYGDISEAAAVNARLLEQVMSDCGFRGYAGEWWHYTDTTDYSKEDLKTLELPTGANRMYVAACQEYINLRSAPDYEAESLLRIPAGASMELLGLIGPFARVQYGTQQGYVAADYITVQNSGNVR